MAKRPLKNRDFKFTSVNMGQLQNYGEHSAYASAYDAWRSDYHPIANKRREEFNTGWAHHSIQALHARQTLRTPEEKPVKYRGRPANKTIIQRGMSLN